jgi:hypothetical protein
MKVIRFNVRNLRNEEWFQLLSDFKKAVGPKAAELTIEDLFVLFILLYDKTDKVLELLNKSVYTQEMEDADNGRDHLFSGLYATVKAALNQPNALKHAAARRLNILLDHYKKAILNGNYNAESAAIYNLLQDLRGEYAADVNLLILTDWVEALAETEEQFLAIRDQRFDESAAKPKAELRQLRLQTEPVYQSILNVLDAKLLAAGLGGNTLDDDDDDNNVPASSTGNVIYAFVLKWNETAKKYRNLLAQRQSRAAKKQKPESDAPETPEENN